MGQKRSGGAGAEEAARFYASVFPDSSVGAVLRAPGDFPSGKKGDVLTVEFTVMGIPCIGFNGGPAFDAMMEMGKIDNESPCHVAGMVRA